MLITANVVLRLFLAAVGATPVMLLLGLLVMKTIMMRYLRSIIYQRRVRQ